MHESSYSSQLNARIYIAQNKSLESQPQDLDYSSRALQLMTLWQSRSGEWQSR